MPRQCRRQSRDAGCCLNAVATLARQPEEILDAIVEADHGRAAAVRAALSRKELAKPDAVLAEIKVAVERISATTKQVMDFAVVAVAAQHRAVELVTRRTRANVSELKALAA